MVTFLHWDFTRYKAKTKERETCINKPVYQQTNNYSALFVCVLGFRKRKRFATLSKQTVFLLITSNGKELFWLWFMFMVCPK